MGIRAIKLPSPTLQVDFARALEKIRNMYLQEALSRTVEGMDITKIDQELARFVSKQDLAVLARHGLRAELIFTVPIIIQKNPYLLGYYRLLLGFSQKEFYTSVTGLSSFKSMEERGIITDSNRENIAALCSELNACASLLVKGIGVKRISKELMSDLTLLTLGPQLRGGANVKKGKVGILEVFEIIHDILGPFIVKEDKRTMIIKNSAGRTVSVEFSSDPDIVIRENMSKGSIRNIIAIEVKGGTDFSNIHNRIGEAEKSHQKARQNGFVECWTVVNVDKIDVAQAHKESPSTNHFFRISALLEQKGPEFEDFKNRIISLTGIPSK